ncbi:MAG: 16S rRNA (adenine(1518)-N(6)/adenine(1519)-N(6))-dimethyltransferase RsmA [Planctomycetota bacterium]|nr:16S rRNA (adenine(1518)-N(6)/adenine(1519)-N(6))-dimethyltransferase RsmA [Planctomycetota bacterium]
MKLFAEHGFHPRGDLGQNFLIDLNLMEFVVRSGGLQPSDVVLEIGAGTGGMTSMIAPHVSRVLSIEIDSNMYEIARETTAPFENVTLLRTDVLKNKNRFSAVVVETLQRILAESPDPVFKLIANLPYNVATPVMSNLVASDLPWSVMVVTIQWELAQKMVAKHGESGYGALAVWLQSQCQVKILKKVKPTVFWPRPQVDSAIVRLEPLENPPAKIDDRRFFQDFIRRLFSQRRKLLRSVLIGMFRKQLTKPDVDRLLVDGGFAENARAENLDISHLVALSNRFRREIAGTSSDILGEDESEESIEA